MTSVLAKPFPNLPEGLLVVGQWIPGVAQKRFNVENPATGETIATIADASAEDALAAVETAAAHQREWGKTPPRIRADILRRAFDLMVERQDDLAHLMTMEMGKPLAESRSEVVYAAEFFRWFSEETVRISGSWRTAPDGKSRLITMKQPIGPCLLITPWNFLLAMGTRKIGPALAAGCTVIVKPAQQTPLSMLALAAILVEAGLPEGVLSVLTTTSAREVVTSILNDARIRKLSFTGSTSVGKALVKQSADNLLKVSMELGGNAPFIVFEDANLEKSVDEAMLAKLRNNGEACTAANRMYVHESIADEFTSRLAERFARLVIGPGTDPTVTLGPLIDQHAVAKVDELVQDAIERGASLVIGGPSLRVEGYYYDAAILARVPFDARIMREEVFGPVAPIAVFTSEEEVLSAANASEYGLAAYVFTKDLDRAIRMSEGLEAGMVAVNRGVLSNTAAPFGGIKSSGFGREGGSEGIEEYLEIKYVALQTE